MLAKLETRYNEKQIEYLSFSTYLDPRLKKKVNFNMHSFKAKIKEISDSYTNCILDTQSQMLDSIEN